MYSKEDIATGCLVYVVLIAVVVVLTALPVMWLWNWLMPELFGLSTLTFWQALGLSALTSLLFKSYNTGTSGKK